MPKWGVISPETINVLHTSPNKTLENHIIHQSDMILQNQNGFGKQVVGKFKIIHSQAKAYN